MEGGIPDLLGAAVCAASTRLTSHPVPATQERRNPGAVGTGATPEHIGQRHHPPGTSQPDKTAENRHDTISNQSRPAPE